MNIVIGAVIVLTCVIVGYLMAHGNLMVLFQPSEFVVIGGAAIGSMLIGTPISVIKEMISTILGHIGNKNVNREDATTLLQTLYNLSTLMRKQGKLALEPHLENPTSSDILGKIAHRHRILELVVDALRLISMDTALVQLIEMMDKDLEVKEEELNEPAEALAHVAEALPGLGIVAAVLGIIVTMNSIGGDSATVGKHVAAALVGTFLGVLMSYGFLAPLSLIVKRAGSLELALLKAASAGITMIATEANPLIVAEAARRSIPEELRPEFNEMENMLRGG